MNRDRYDLPLTTASDRAAAHYRDGVDCMLSAWHGAEDAFDKAIAEDPGFALAHIGRARHTEAGNLSTGRTLSERAMALRSENANAAHGLSHAMFEQGDMAVGRKFLAQWMPSHDRKSFLHGHLAWHVALTNLDEGDLDGALAIYEQHIKPAGRPYPPLNIFTDGASLLWRLSLAGKAGLEPHWRDVAAYGEKYFPQAGAHFADVHFALAAAMAGGDTLDTRLAQLEARAADGKLAPGGCAIDLCRGIRAFAAGDHDGAVRLLEPAISELTRIGGSHAQRQLWEDTLIVAYLRAGHGGKAARRISTRLDCRPSARDEAWSRQARRN